MKEIIRKYIYMINNTAIHQALYPYDKYKEFETYEIIWAIIILPIMIITFPLYLILNYIILTPFRLIKNIINKN